MKITDIQGLKYPDDYFIKYFFKTGYHKTYGLKFIEFGASNGNNLMLPYEYGHNVIGIDIEQKAIDNANLNFKNIHNKTSTFEFHKTDMREYANKTTGLNADVFMLPNIVNYIPREDLNAFLNLMVQNNNIKHNASIFVRCRTPKDFRFGMGKKVNYNAYQLDTTNDITGEAGCLNTFYTEFDLISTLQQHLNLRNFTLLNCNFQNIQNDTVISNSDIILWGTIN